MATLTEVLWLNCVTMLWPQDDFLRSSSVYQRPANVIAESGTFAGGRGAGDVVPVVLCPFVLDPIGVSVVVADVLSPQPCNTRPKTTPAALKQNDLLIARRCWADQVQ
jgi:hypothetical protein